MHKITALVPTHYVTECKYLFLIPSYVVFHISCRRYINLITSRRTTERVLRISFVSSHSTHVRSGQEKNQHSGFFMLHRRKERTRRAEGPPIHVVRSRKKKKKLKTNSSRCRKIRIMHWAHSSESCKQLLSHLLYLLKGCIAQRDSPVEIRHVLHTRHRLY